MNKQMTKTVKSYGTTSHAKRALNGIGLAALQAYDKLVTITEEGRYEFILEKAEAIQDKADNAKQDSYDEPSTKEKAQHRAKEDRRAAPPVAAKVEREVVKAVTKAIKETVPPVVKAAVHKGVEKAAAKPAPVVVPIVASVQDIVRESTVERPCKLVWHIADAMQGARRKDILAACVAKGVAFYTARTQYQLWLSVKNGTAK